MKYQIKIGLAPIRRDVTPRPGIFNWEKAEIRGRRMVKYIEEQFTDDRVSFVDTKGITPVDVLITEDDARAAGRGSGWGHSTQQQLWQRGSGSSAGAGTG